MPFPALDFRALFDASANPYMLLDRELRYVTANRAYLETTGSRLEELIGRHVLDAFPNDPSDATDVGRSRLKTSLEQVLATGERDVLAFLPYRVARAPGAPAEER
ncbi:PAS domain S-box protein, partial [bacterium]